MNKIIDAEDILDEAQGCIECIYMAASEFTNEGRNPFHTVADIASKKIDAAIALLHEYLEFGDAPVPAAAAAKPKSPARAKWKGQ
jgi:hypothetical protein